MNAEPGAALVFFLLLFTPAFAADGVPLAIKPGLWETVSTAHSNGQSQSFTTQSCVTKEAPDRAFVTGLKTCTHDLVAGSSRSETLRVQCTVGAMVTHGTIEIEVIDSEHIKAKSHVTATGGIAMDVETDFTGHFVKADCGRIRAGAS